jgi:serine/threonine protein kinase
MSRRRDTEPVAISPAEEQQLSLSPGQVVAGTQLVIHRAIGRGGMGEVYEVQHGALARRCVLKVLREVLRGRADLAARLRDEAQALANLRHPNLVAVYDAGTLEDGRPYFVMELLHGLDVQKRLRQGGRLGCWEAVDCVIQVLEGMAAAHAEGIVHRDVKPENVFVCHDGTVKLLDFGVAKLTGLHEPRSCAGVALGTPRMMAPEQHRFEHVDPRTDVYAVGLLLYELVAGRGPFDEHRGNAVAMQFAHCARPAVPPSAFAPVPGRLEELILRAIAKAPEERFGSAREMADALREVRGERRRRRGSAPPPAPSGWMLTDATTTEVGSARPSYAKMDLSFGGSVAGTLGPRGEVRASPLPLAKPSPPVRIDRIALVTTFVIALLGLAVGGGALGWIAAKGGFPPARDFDTVRACGP